MTMHAQLYLGQVVLAHLNVKKVMDRMFTEIFYLISTYYSQDISEDEFSRLVVHSQGADDIFKMILNLTFRTAKDREVPHRGKEFHPAIQILTQIENALMVANEVQDPLKVLIEVEMKTVTDDHLVDLEFSYEVRAEVSKGKILVQYENRPLITGD